MILFSVSVVCVILLLILSYKQVIVNVNRFTILVFPGIINFILGFSFILMLMEESIYLYIIAIITGFITFLLLTSILLTNNKKAKAEQETTLVGQTATITGFIVKSHKFYVYIAEVDGFIIFVNSSQQLTLNSQVILTNYQNNQYFI